MGCRRKMLGGLGALLALLASAAAPASGQEGRPGPAVRLVSPAEAPAGAFGLPRVPVEQLPPELRDKVQQVLEQPTLSAPGQAESFACQPALYHWLLDHPNQCVGLWRQMGARVTHIEERGNGWFAWVDGQGSEVRWGTVLRTPELRVWYAEGRVKPGVLLPSAQVRAVVVMYHRELQDAKGKTGIRHQARLYVTTDSRAMNLAARLMGGTAPRLAEQYMGQLEMFYGALAWYLDQDAERAARMFAKIGVAVPPGTPAPRAGQPEVKRTGG
jgi:hypothetical protein